MGAPARWVVRVGLGLFTVQAAVTLGLLFELPGDVLDATARVHGSAEAITGASLATRVAVVDGVTGRTVGGEPDVDVATLPAMPVGGPEHHGDAFVAAHVTGVESTPLRWVVAAPGDDALPVTVTTPAITESRTDWIDTPGTYDAGAAERRRSPNAATERPPGVWALAATDECPIRLHVSPGGGTPVMGMTNRFSLRLADEHGGPVADRLLTIERRDGESVSRARTDSMGIARVDLRLEEVEDWSVRFSCAAVEITRRFSVVATWDGVVLVSPKAVVAPVDELRLGVSQERSWGNWHLDVVCDGVWLATTTTPVQEGPSFVSFDRLRLPSRSRPTLCRVQGTSFLLAPDPPRSSVYVIVRAANGSAQSAVNALANRAAEYGSEALRAQLGPATAASLDAASAAEIESFGRWLLDALPPSFEPMPLLHDDAPRARSVHEAGRAKRLRSLTRLLVIDVVILLSGVAVIVGVGVWRRRVRIRALVEEDVEADFALLDDRAQVWFALAGAAVIALSLVGILMLTRLLQ